MKKQLTAVLLIVALLMTVTGCSAAGALQSLDAAENKVEATLDAVEDTIESAVRRAAPPAPTAPSTQPAAPTEADPASTAQTASNLITKEGAQQIALDYLNLDADQVKRMHTDYEIDDGTGQYDVEFISGDWEYEFEIHAETGKILSFDKDHKRD